MAIITDTQQVKELYAQAAERKWVLPCFCTENLTTTEAVLSAASQYSSENGIDDVPIIIAMTCRYSHRPQAVNYTHTQRWDTGLKLFIASLNVLAGKGGPFEHLRVMVHLDHIQHDEDRELLEWDLSGFSSILYDASTLPMNQNMQLTARFVEKMKGRIVVEGACDEIADASGNDRIALTSPDVAAEYIQQTGVDLLVANLGTEHRAGAKNLQYHSLAALAIKERIGSHIVLHGTSSVSNDQVANLYSDGVCKVNIWTALERDASPVLFEDLIKHASQAAGSAAVERLIAEGWLGQRCRSGEPMSLSHFTTSYRQGIVFDEMKKIVLSYLKLWYK